MGHTRTGIIGSTIAVAGNGDVGVTYYDSRHDRAGDKSWTTDVFLANSGDGSKTWKEGHVAGPFDLATAPHEEAHPGAFLTIGDYFGLAGLPHGFAAAFTMAQPKSVHGSTDIFFARVRARP